MSTKKNMLRLSVEDNRRPSWRSEYLNARLMTAYVGGISAAVGILAACLFLSVKGHKRSVKVFWTCSGIAYSLTSLLLIYGTLKNRRYLFVPWVMFILMGLAAYTKVFDSIFGTLMIGLLLSVIINFIFLGIVIYQYRTLSRLSN
ncbi:uncharacterized protein LOC117589211 [Drosophila guanche]|uniref:uncharacterized protein LOC117589211 n=1 Tax=Drosophila guanche TaxID=7266 RepID=UPI001471FCB6|nr:uncharacterized protein LOC117589211 [Drosophila guanche]